MGFRSLCVLGSEYQRLNFRLTVLRISCRHCGKPVSPSQGVLTEEARCSIEQRKNCSSGSGHLRTQPCAHAKQQSC